MKEVLSSKAKKIKKLTDAFNRMQSSSKMLRGLISPGNKLSLVEISKAWDNPLFYGKGSPVWSGVPVNRFTSEAHRKEVIKAVNDGWKVVQDIATKYGIELDEQAQKAHASFILIAQKALSKKFTTTNSVVFEHEFEGPSKKNPDKIVNHRVKRTVQEVAEWEALRDVALRFSRYVFRLQNEVKRVASILDGKIAKQAIALNNIQREEAERNKDHKKVLQDEIDRRNKELEPLDGDDDPVSVDERKRFEKSNKPPKQMLNKEERAYDIIRGDGVIIKGSFDALAINAYQQIGTRISSGYPHTVDNLPILAIHRRNLPPNLRGDLSRVIYELVREDKKKYGQYLNFGLAGPAITINGVEHYVLKPKIGNTRVSEWSFAGKINTYEDY